MSHLLNPSANHAALLREVPSCNSLLIKDRAPLRELIINPFFILCVCVCYVLSRPGRAAPRCHIGLCQWTEILGCRCGEEQRWRRRGGVAARRLLHFCTRLITLTFDHVLCSGSRSHGSCAASLLLPPQPPTIAAATSIAIQKQICILCSDTTLTFGRKEDKLSNGFLPQQTD